MHAIAKIAKNRQRAGDSNWMPKVTHRRVAIMAKIAILAKLAIWGKMANLARMANLE